MGVSRLNSLHEAPQEGYTPSADFGNNARGGGLAAYLKIRAGEPGGPLFGKLRDPVSYWAERDYDEFEFEYVINPSGDRGLEIDRDKIKVPSGGKLDFGGKMDGPKGF